MTSDELETLANETAKVVRAVVAEATEPVRGELVALGARIAQLEARPQIGDALERRLHAVEVGLAGTDLVNARIAKLEQRAGADMSMLADAFTGPWKEARGYRRGELVQLGGSVWIALQDCEAPSPRPGDTPHFRLLVKAGRRGRDAPGASENGRDKAPLGNGRNAAAEVAKA